MFREDVLRIVFLIFVLFLAGCDRVTRHPAEAVVEEMYAALQDGDREAYMDTMLPTNRRLPNPLYLLENLAIFAGPVGFELADLTAVSFQELEIRVVQTDDDYALVQVDGYVRYPALMWELHFCDQHDVRNVDGEWYVDVYAPERAERIDRLLERRRKRWEDTLSRPDASSPESLEALQEILGTGMDQVLNFCEAQ